jgi:hypothetical protein
MTTHASIGPDVPATSAGDRQVDRSHGVTPAAVRTGAGHRPRLEADGSIVDGQRARDVEHSGLHPVLELRVFGNGQYYGRFLMGPSPGARPTTQARLVAVALAEQVRHAFSAAGVPAASP